MGVACCHVTETLVEVVVVYPAVAAPLHSNLSLEESIYMYINFEIGTNVYNVHV